MNGYCDQLRAAGYWKITSARSVAAQEEIEQAVTKNFDSLLGEWTFIRSCSNCLFVFAAIESASDFARPEGNPWRQER